MESQCDYFMYFPSVPISSLSDQTEYATLPRRNHVYLGETVQFLFILRSRDAVRRNEGAGVPPLKDLMGSLTAQASVCVSDSRQERPGEYEQEHRSSSGSEDGREELPGERETGTPDNPGEGVESQRTLRQNSAILVHSSASDRGQNGGETVKLCQMSRRSI